MPDDWKSMVTVGAGVYEIRIRTGLREQEKKRKKGSP